MNLKKDLKHLRENGADNLQTHLTKEKEKNQPSNLKIVIFLFNYPENGKFYLIERKNDDY